MPEYAKLRDDLVSSPAEVDGATVYNIKDPITGTYFRLREPEFWLVRQLDGHTPYDEIAARFKERFDLAITADNVVQFVDALEKLFFLEDARSEQATSRSSYGRGTKRSLFSRMLFIKIRAFAPGRFLDRLTALYRPFHSVYVFGLQAMFIAAGIALLLANAHHFRLGLAELFNLGSILTVVLSIFVLVALHELAHAVVCRYHGGEVREMGFLLLYFQPCLYTDLSDAWLFRHKRSRLVVTWAGLYFQLILLATTVFLWRVTVPGSSVNDVARIMVGINVLLIAFNFNPLIKLDGYYLLSDWLDIPNLRHKSFEYLGNLFKRRLLGWPIERTPGTRREHRIFLTYSVLALVYSAFLIGYILVVVAQFVIELAGGLGLLLLLAVLGFTLKTGIGRVLEGVVEHVKHMKSILKSPLRLTIHVIVAIALIVLLLFVPFPQRVTGEVTVRPIAECTLLLNDLGLLETKLRRGGPDTERRTTYLQMTTTEMASLELVPRVSDGQEVARDDTVAVLISNQVVKEIAAESSVLEKLRSELALLKSPPKKEEIAEAEAQVAAALTEFEQASRDLNRIKGLAAKELATEEETETAQSSMDVAFAELQNKRARLSLLRAPPKPEEEAVLNAEIERQEGKLEFLRSQLAAQSIRAPIAGRIDIGHGDDKILSIVDDRRIELLTPVSDFDIGLVQLGQEVKLKVRTHPTDLFLGCVTHVPSSAEFDGDRSYFPVSVIVDNPDRRLRKGMTGYSKIEIRKTSLLKLILRKVASVVRVEFWSWW